MVIYMVQLCTVCQMYYQQKATNTRQTAEFSYIIAYIIETNLAPQLHCADCQAANS